jgi:hypothetical protein
MNWDEIWPLIAAAGVIVLYGALVRGATILAQPLRDRLAEVAAELMSKKNLSTETRAEVEFHLERSFSSIDAWLLVALVIPAFVLRGWNRWQKNAICEPPADERSLLVQLRLLSIITVLSNSPLATLLFSIEIAAASLFMKSASVFQSLFGMVTALHPAHPRQPRAPKAC